MVVEHKITKEASDRFAEVDGVKIHYNEAGEGPALLCFHGGGPGANAWDNTKHNIDAFSEHFRTLLVDLPAYGESDKSMKLGDTPLDISWGNTVLGLMDQLGIDKAHLFSSSQSGPMSLRLGIDHPDRVGKIILQSSGAGGGRMMFQPSPPEGIKALGVFAQNPVRENMEKMMHLFIPNDELCTEEVIEARFQAAIRPGHLEARAEFSASKNTDLSLAHRQVAGPRCSSCGGTRTAWCRWRERSRLWRRYRMRSSTFGVAVSVTSSSTSAPTSSAASPSTSSPTEERTQRRWSRVSDPRFSAPSPYKGRGCRR